MSTKSLTTRSFTKFRTLDSTDVKSFIDINLKGSSVQKITGDSPVGYASGTVYTTSLSINSTPLNISISGESVSTIAQLAAKINSQISGTASATFVELDKCIRISANASGSIAASIVTVGNLVSGIVGDKSQSLSASYGTPCGGGGVNFSLTNTASVGSPIYAGYIVQGRTSAGAEIAVTATYDSTNGNLQVKKASGSFSATDLVTVVGNLF